ncbi:glycoside hydrolase family 13 protein [Whalleya microplaca]|nr:glycoside hydrolase family 13 protein [Whalleya microplaca]
MNGLHRHQNGWYGKEPWWKEATFYQVYPASFKDSNGDGWGDIPGLISEIEYLHELGVDVVWLSPVFESPQTDMGYDVSDYQKIYAAYGTVEDVDTLVEACHARGMKLILDLVVNHTSIEHAWFKESRSSKDNPKRDWYIWKPPRYNEKGERIPPTNWRGYFAGPTWTWDEHTQEYYLHLYAPDQPDLNWESDACREAVYENTMHFWLRRGVDGFRIDTVNKYSKRTEYADSPITEPASPHQPAPQMWCNGPRIHEFIHEMQERALAPYGAVSVGELSNTPLPSQVVPYVSAAARELDMVFEFSMIRLGTGGMFGPKYIYVPFTLPQFKAIVAKWQTFIEGTDAWTTVFCENHDNGRAVSRFGSCETPELWAASAKTLALWQATLTGTLFLYQGQEIGMTNMPAHWPIEEYKDVESRSFYAEALESGDAKRIKDTMAGLRILARDHSRLPFQWDDGPNAGFTAPGVEAWMRVHDDYVDINAKKQRQDPESILSFYKSILKLRKQYKDLFVFGAFRLLALEDEGLFAYVKESTVEILEEKTRVNGSNGTNGTNGANGANGANGVNGASGVNGANGASGANGAHGLHVPGKKRKALVVLNFSKESRECLDARDVLGSGDEDVVRLLVSTLAPGDMSYAAAAASGPKQSAQDAAAPQPPSVETSESSASTGSLVDVDTPSVRTVPSDYLEQDVQTETQAAREELEDAAARARAEADLAKKKGRSRARRADNYLTQWFAQLSDGTSNAIAAANLAALVGVGSFFGYKAWGLYDHGRLGWKNVGLGVGVLAALGTVQGLVGGYIYKAKKRQS